ncbi:hypothetical protein [Streptomyces sp. TRM49041]|uniref:hypothetical protein n=1 Tax=Streptomyces sp. TRM49041 TaxID=2603216 RepID=UPI0011EEBBEB|nr:hypothetical protein [Streptomyces sp. TRM49041]
MQGLAIEVQQATRCRRGALGVIGATGPSCLPAHDRTGRTRLWRGIGASTVRRGHSQAYAWGMGLVPSGCEPEVPALPVGLRRRTEEAAAVDTGDAEGP